MADAPKSPVSAGLSRRQLFAHIARGAAVLAAAGGVAAAASKSPVRTVWQIDPDKCTQCGRCATHCIKSPSAVKCVHAYAVCGYCDLCTGYLEPDHLAKDTAAENQVCPTNALIRRFVEDPYFSYTIDENACIGCARCVKGCTAYGNGSLFLQIRHDQCDNCNQCAIASVCPADAIHRVPADKPYKIKSKPGNA